MYFESDLYLMRRRKLGSAAACIGVIGEDVASYMYNEMINDMLHCLDEIFSEVQQTIISFTFYTTTKLPQGIILQDSLSLYF